MGEDPTTVDGADAPTARQIVDRLRLILWICLVGACVFTLREALVPEHPLAGQFAIRLIGIALTAIGIVALQSSWAVRWAYPLSIGIVGFAYLITASAGMVSESREYVTTAVLFVGAAMTTATMVPWGLPAQLVTTGIAALTLIGAVLWRDGDLGMLATDPGMAVAMGFLFAGVTAREFDRHRAALRHELHERRGAEEALRRLNVHLEDRVVERTTALQTVNDRLAAEVAERRRAIEALRASEGLLADTVDHSTAIISLKDVRGRYLLVNREFERLFGHARIEVVGRRDEDLFSAPLARRLGARDEDVLRSGVAVSFEQELIGNGRAHSYVCVKFPLHGPDGTTYGVGSMATDISVLKQLQEELRRHQDELAHVLRLHTVGEMAATLAHEINQPLCAITNYAQGSVQRLRNGAIEPTALLQAFERIGTEGMRAAQILRSIRTLVQREQSATDSESAVDVNAVAGEAVRVLEAQARQQGVTVRLEPGGELPSVQGNATQIEQVMVNLMLNGVQATANSAGARREVVVSTNRTGAAIEVTVRDTGSGVAPTVAERLFTPFVTTKARGFGLGLAISRTIVENHGGRLWAVQGAGSGSTFRFTLPVPDDVPA